MTTTTTTISSSRHVISSLSNSATSVLRLLQQGLQNKEHSQLVVLLNRRSLSTQATSNTAVSDSSSTSTKQHLNKKDRVVVLGTGWGGFNLALNVDQKAVDLTIISPRNHFIFTPLLPSTADVSKNQFVLYYNHNILVIMYKPKHDQLILLNVLYIVNQSIMNSFQYRMIN
jgi:hypothetical protein